MSRSRRKMTTGWIPPEERKFLPMGDPWTAEIPDFSDVGKMVGDLPSKCLTPAIEIDLLGKIIPRVWQVTGSCVGAGAANAYVQAMAGDVFHRGDFEEIKLPFPYATYGVGRQIAGMGGRGEGSFGSAQAKACSVEEFGILPVDYEKAPQPLITGNWAKWTSQQEFAWSHPNVWPVSRDHIEPDAKKFGFHKIARAREIIDVKQALAQGYGVTVASMYGSTRMQVQGRGDNAVLIADRNTQWLHQMSVFGYWEHPEFGDLFAIQNQWGTSIHPRCPQLEPLGITGAFWMRGNDFKNILRSQNGEVFVHSSTGGFPVQNLDWEKLSYAWNYPPFA